MSIRKMVAPLLYIQGRGAIGHLGQKAKLYGTRAFVVGEAVALSVAGDKIRRSLTANGIEIAGWNDSVKECSFAAIDKLAEEGKDLDPHFVVGVGGGKALDTAKAVAMKLRVPAISVGTQCATNADASGESVVYSENHEYVDCIKLPRNPVVVIEDTDIVAKAPLKFIVQGMGDALSCKFEAEAYTKARERKKDGEIPTAAALGLADVCYRCLMGSGLKAVKDLKEGVHSSDVDKVIEAVKLSSALAFENTGSSLAHALHNGLTKTRKIRGEHGEIVAYATIVMAVYQGRPKEEVRMLIEWCDNVGLPTKLKHLGKLSKAELTMAVEHACFNDPDINNMPEEVKPSDLLRAIEEVERGL